MHGHYISIYGDLKNEYVIELYDSLALLNNNATKKYKYEIDKIYNKFQKLINDMNIEYICKFKTNYIQNQSINSDTCGLFAISFLLKDLIIYHGKMQRNIKMFQKKKRKC